MRIGEKEHIKISIKIDIRDINGYGFFNDDKRSPFLMVRGGEIPITEREFKKYLHSISK